MGCGSGNSVKAPQSTKVDRADRGWANWYRLVPAQAGIDGSPHDWFEGRAPRCTLIVFIDDAISRALALHFSPTETTQAYMETLNQQLDKHGRPSAMYSDKHSIFRVNRPDKEGELTQFTRVLKTLDIEPIHANT